MGFPVVLDALEGEQYNAYTYTAQQSPAWPVGTQMRMQDGRKYRFVLNGGATQVVGNVLQSAANVANHVTQTASINAAGIKNPTNTLGATLATANQYANGYLAFTTTPGGGELYLINDHLANAGSAALITNLAGGHVIRTATSASSTFSLYRNPYAGVIQSPVTTPTNAAVGVAVKAMTSGQYGWIQTGGTAMVLVSGTPVLANRAVLLPATAGAAGPAAAATSAEIGIVQEVGATWMAVLLKLDN